mgnify:CR=1 FL=1
MDDSLCTSPQGIHKWILLTTQAYEEMIFVIETGASVKGCVVCGLVIEKVDGDWDPLLPVNPYYDSRMHLFSSKWPMKAWKR